MTDIIEPLRAAFQRKRYGGGDDYDPDYDLFDVAADEIERLRALLGKLHWKSIDKDNMEYRCDITCYVMDEIRAALTRCGQ
jgi:hypothetical protein